MYRGETVGEALAGTTHLAEQAERLGYRRIWYAEHHNLPTIASAATSVLLAHVAAATSTITLGSGGVMLPNHAPLTVAEQFGTLASLHPGRIELGLGRAPGTDQRTLTALRRSPAAAQHFPQDVQELLGYLDDASVVPGVRAVPGQGTRVPVWVLGSSLFGAQLAAHLGLPYAFASHFAPAALEQAIEVYRARFEPSSRLDRPHVMVGVNAIAAPDVEEADRLLRAAARQRVKLVLTRPGQHLSDEEADAVLDDPAGAPAWEMLRFRAVGTPEQVVAELSRFQQQTQADELIVSSVAPERAAALRTVTMMAQAAQPSLAG